MAKLIDILNKTDWFDGEIIIGGLESEYSFVWDGDLQFTDYGKEYFAPILEGETTLDSDNNLIEVECDAEEELIDKFNATIAGYVGENFYNSVLVDEKLKRILGE